MFQINGSIFRGGIEMSEILLYHHVQGLTDGVQSGVRGIALVASADTIMSGAVDPLADLADVARRHDRWFHVDGAYGAAAALAAPEKFVGLSKADSISLDAHKWLYQPLDCSVLLYRDANIARKTFAYSAEYVKTTSDDPVEAFAFFEQTIELSRRFRALKLWLSLRYHGLGAFRGRDRRKPRAGQNARRADRCGAVAGAARPGRAERRLLSLDKRRRRQAGRTE
jgi:hypothetical protein